MVAVRIVAVVLALQFLPLNAFSAEEEDEENGGITLEFFYEYLSQFGQWMFTREFGWVWKPAGAGDDWQPYADGMWIWTDFGWTWVSDYEWGWACFHYGRWAFVSPDGWVWVPGTEWSPAWVVWRVDVNYVGWAPLPPGCTYELLGCPYWPTPYYWWVFVEHRNFCGKKIRDTCKCGKDAKETHDRTLGSDGAGGRAGKDSQGGSPGSGMAGEQAGKWMSGPEKTLLEKVMGRIVEKHTITRADFPGPAAMNADSLKLFKPAIVIHGGFSGRSGVPSSAGEWKPQAPKPTLPGPAKIREPVKPIVPGGAMKGVRMPPPPVPAGMGRKEQDEEEKKPQPFPQVVPKGVQPVFK